MVILVSRLTETASLVTCLAVRAAGTLGQRLPLRDAGRPLSGSRALLGLLAAVWLERETNNLKVIGPLKKWRKVSN